MCPRHRDRVAYVRCQRCERPTCPDCQRPAAVGIHCVDCVRAQPAVVARTVAGAPPGDRRPLVSIGYVVLLVGVWLAQLAAPGVTDALALRPSLSQSEPWRLLGVGLVHSPTSPLHLLFNCVVLLGVGRELEPQLGRLRHVALLTGSTFGGSVAVLWLTPTTAGDWFSATVGASGAVFGLLGAGVVLSARQGHAVGRQLGFLLLLTVVGVFVPATSFELHLGGLVGGLLVAGVLVLAPRSHRTRAQVGGLVAVVLLLLALTVLRWVVVGPSVLV